MDLELKTMLLEQQAKIEEIYKTVEKTRKYIFWTMIASIVFFVLPLIALIFIVPLVIKGYLSTLTGLGL